MKPMAGCKLFGATRVISGIRDAVVLQHSVIGCNWGTLTFRYTQNSFDIRQASSVIYGEDLIQGGHELLAKALQNVEELYPDLPVGFVISGCVPNLIGDDVEAVLRGATTNKKLLHIAAPGYAGSIEDGMEAALLALSALAEDCGKTEFPSINIFGVLADDPYADNDMRTLRNMLREKVKINCSLHDCTTMELCRLPAAHLNVVFGYGEKLAASLQEKFGTPWMACEYPYGIQGMCDFLTRLGAALDVDFQAEMVKLQLQGRGLTRKSAVYLDALYQAPVAVAGDKAHLPGLVRFLQSELGMDVVAQGVLASCDENSFLLEAQNKAATLIFGSDMEVAAAATVGLPAVACMYPVVTEMNFTSLGLLGGEGTAHLLEKIVNAVLQHRYKLKGLWYGLQESQDAGC